jgi:hypothetical protein
MHAGFMIWRGLFNTRKRSDTPMTSVDLRTLCTALGFTAVVMKSQRCRRNSARRALGFAHLIEDFCTYARECEDGTATRNAKAPQPRASLRRAAQSRAKKK